MAMMQLPMSNEVVMLSSIASAGIAAGFLRVVVELRLSASLVIGAAIGIGLYLAGVVPIGVLIAVGIGLLVTLWKLMTSSAPAERNQPGIILPSAPTSVPAPTTQADVMQRMMEVLNRTKFSAADFGMGFDRGLLRFKDDDDKAYYVGYLTALAQGHCQALGLIWGDAMNLTAWQVAETLFPAYAADRPDVRFAKIARDFSPYFSMGLKEGEHDIAYALNPANAKPYWVHLIAKLGAPEAKSA